jgi:hypothetical protein
VNGCASHCWSKSKGLRPLAAAGTACLLWATLSSVAHAGTEQAAIPTTEELLAGAEASIAGTRDYTATVTKQERMKGREGLRPKEVMQFKFARPFRVHIKFLAPNAGREMVFVTGWNDNKLKVRTGSFPDVVLNLNPRGKTAMQGNHHPVQDIGLENAVRITAKSVREALSRNEGSFTVSDAGTLDGQPVWKLTATLPQAVAETTTVRKGETLWHIADRVGQDMYLMLYLTPKYDSPDDAREGDQVLVPRYYGGRIEILFDKDIQLPISVSVWDWQGNLYETFSYTGLKLNVGLTERDFAVR